MAPMACHTEMSFEFNSIDSKTLTHHRARFEGMKACVV